MSQTPPNHLSRWAIALFQQVDAGSLVLFRIGFGLLLLWDVIRYVAKDWIAAYWIVPRYHFGYWPLEFLRPLPGDGMYYLFAVLGIAAVGITIGFLYRISTAIFLVGFTYTFLLEQTRYLNHFYLMILLAFVMVWVPANRSFSVDAWLFPRIRSATAPLWSLGWLRFTVALPYFFGGVAKLNADWLHGQPMQLWLLGKTDIPVIGPWMANADFLLGMAWAGTFVDLLMVPALLWRRTRGAAFVVAILFNLMNATMFDIGIFPWMMIAGTTLFFSPDWVRKLLQRLPRRFAPRASFAALDLSQSHRPSRWLLGLIAVFVTVQIALPLRHFLIPGNVHWTEEGHRYAWHMKLRSKRAYGFFVVRAAGTAIDETIDPEAYLEDWQAEGMLGKPYLIWQFAQILHDEARQNGQEVQVFANIHVSLNGRKYQAFTDPTVDLAQVPRPIWPGTDWILPLTTRLEE